MKPSASAAASLLLLPVQAWAAPLSAQVFFQEPAISQACLSPDGRLFGSAAYQGFDAVFEYDAVAVRPKGSPIAAVLGLSLRPDCLGNDKGLLGTRFVVDAEITQWLEAGLLAVQATIDQMLPPGGGKRLPLVVPAHGGPWECGGRWTFDPEVCASQAAPMAATPR